jgi:hypothetical protein
MMLAWLWIPYAAAGSVHADQARIFVKRRYFDEALAEVSAGLADPTTADALELYAIGVDAAWEVGDIDRVLLWSQQAADLALNDDAHAGWQARHDSVASSWGWLTLNLAASPKRIAIEPASPVFDPEQKRIAALILLRLQGQPALPDRIPLPAGEWRVNGAPAVVVSGATTTVAPPEGKPKGPRVEIGSAGLLLLGERVRGFSPSVGPTLGVSAATGRIRVGGLVRWSPQARLTDDAQLQTAWLAGSAGLNAALSIPLSGAIALSPAVGVEADLLGKSDANRWVAGAGPAAQLALEWRGASGATLGITVGGCWIADLDEPLSAAPASGLRIGAYLGF